jgi:hypothetical protein
MSFKAGDYVRTRLGASRSVWIVEKVNAPEKYTFHGKTYQRQLATIRLFCTKWGAPIRKAHTHVQTLDVAWLSPAQLPEGYGG